MTRIKYIIYIITCIAIGNINSYAQLPYDKASEKADRFFGYQEWASASALYHHMLEQKPDVPSTYGHAIVSNYMNGDSIQGLSLLTRAMSYGISLDEVLSQVKKYSFEVGRSKLYENFMLQAARQYPWLSRPIDYQLLKYYDFRNDGPMMIEYARTMLRGADKDIRFLSILAKGYMLVNDPNSAIDTWQTILTIAPDNYHTLLCLANYYDNTGHKEQALEYFRKAYGLEQSPYVAERLKSLGDGIFTSQN